MRRRRLVRRFQQAGALEPRYAVTLDALGERHSRVFEQMKRRGVFLSTIESHFFMNERVAMEYLRQRRIRAWIGGGLVLLVFLLVWAFGGI